jgi:hypothetical protein
MAYVAPTIRSVGDAVTAADYNIMANDVIALNSSAPSSTVSSLPGSPIDGQIIYYEANATDGIIWQLRYRSASASAYKWEFIGGSPLYKQFLYDGIASSGASYASFSTPVTVTTPLAGDYVYKFGAGGAGPNAGYDIFIGLSIGGATPSIGAGTSIYNYNAATGAQHMRWSTVLEYKKTGVSALTTAETKYLHNAANGNIANPYVSVIPVRVG